MIEQFKWGEFTKRTKFLAIYFIMGQYNKDDKVPEEWFGRDCPFDDSPVIHAETEQELEQKVRGVFNGEGGMDFESCYPDLICDKRGVLLPELYHRTCGVQPTDSYSFGRDSLEQFWEREKHRFVNE